ARIPGKSKVRPWIHARGRVRLGPLTEFWNGVARNQLAWLKHAVRRCEEVREYRVKVDVVFILIDTRKFPAEPIVQGEARVHAIGILKIGARRGVALAQLDGRKGFILMLGHVKPVVRCDTAHPAS